MGDDDTSAIEAFQESRRSFQARWNANFFRRMLPGFFVFGAALFTPDPLRLPLALLGLAGFLWGLGRGVALIFEGRRCPRCRTVQPTQIHFPYRSCPGCGVRLSEGVRDSM